jgi:hypothetical protein
MTHPMPDQPQPATKRMTTAEVAALAQQIDGRLDDLSAVVTDLATRLQDLGQGSGDQNTAATLRVTQDLDNTVAELAEKVAQFPTRDQLDGRIHEALQPLHDEVHELRGKGTLTPQSQSSLAGILARLEDAERKVAGVDTSGIVATVAQQLHPTLSEVRKRLDAVETATRALDSDPVSHTLAEDALADQIEHAVNRKLSAMFEAADLTPAMLANLRREFADLRAHVETHGTHVTRALVNEVASALPTTAAGPVAANGLGAARKVLQLMKLVTHIGKERQADMGQGGKFRFRGVDEAMDAVGHAMREVGVIFSPEVLKEESSTTPVTKKGDGRNGPYESTVLWTTTKLTMRYTFVDPDDGSTHPIEMVGEGRDASDKSTSKAGSMAFKYALLQALCIPVTGLDDSDAAPPQVMENERSTPPATAQAQQPAAAPERTEEQKAARARDALNAIRNVYRVEGGPQAQANRLVQIMNQAKAEGLLGYAVEGASLDQHGHAALATLQAPPPPDDARASTEPPEPPNDYQGSY